MSTTTTTKKTSSLRKPERNAGRQRTDGPRRMCVGCRERLHPNELVRLQLDAAKTLRVVGQRVSRGRGAWVCPRPGCLNALARRPGRLVRALRHQGRLDLTDLADQVRHHAALEAHRALWSSRRAGLCRELAGSGARATSHPRLIGVVCVACPPPAAVPPTEIWALDAPTGPAEEPQRCLPPGVFILLNGTPALRARRWLRRLAPLG